MPTDEQIKEAYAYALAATERLAPRPDVLAEAARDAATDGVLWALGKYDPEAGEFAPFARRSVLKAVGRAIQKHKARYARRPKSISLPRYDTEECPAEEIGDALTARPRHGVKDVDLSIDLSELPEDCRAVIRLFFIDRFPIRHIALLTGLSYRQARKRLLDAADRLGLGLRRPKRPTGTKRMTR